MLEIELHFVEHQIVEVVKKGAGAKESADIRLRINVPAIQKEVVFGSFVAEKHVVLVKLLVKFFVASKFDSILQVSSEQFSEMRPRPHSLMIKFGLLLAKFSEVSE